MLKRLLALLLILTMVISFTGCTLIWGHDAGSPVSQALAEDKAPVSTGVVYSHRHMKTHWEIVFDGINKMHKFFDRHFMNYDWDDPYYN